MPHSRTPGDRHWSHRHGCLMEVQADGRLAPVPAPLPYGHDLAALLPCADAPDDGRPDAPDEERREGADERAERLFPKLLDRDAEDRALLAAEVPAEQRPDGWTLARRQLFLERLADSCSVLEAAASVGLSRQSARKLYRRAPAFRAAWDAALQESVAVLAETAFHRARFGTETEVFHDGRVVGHRTVHHDRLLIYLLRVRDPLNFAPIDEVERWGRQRGLPARARTIEAAPPAPKETSAALAAPHQGTWKHRPRRRLRTRETWKLRPRRRVRTRETWKLRSRRSLRTRETWKLRGSPAAAMETSAGSSAPRCGPRRGPSAAWPPPPRKRARRIAPPGPHCPQKLQEAAP